MEKRRLNDLHKPPSSPSERAGALAIVAWVRGKKEAEDFFDSLARKLAMGHKLDAAERRELDVGFERWMWWRL